MLSAIARCLSRLLVLLAVPTIVGAQEAVPSEHELQSLSAADWTDIRQAYEAGRYAAYPVAGGYGARNPGQEWRTVFDRRGFTTTPDHGAWTWGLALVRYGFAGHLREVSRPARVSTEGARVSYDWDSTLEEWYVNDGRGLEHGYIVRERPPHGEVTGASDERGPLTLTLAVRGELEAEVERDGRDVRFVAEDGATVLTYSGLTVFDSDGRVLPATFERAAGGLRLTVDERHARYPLTIDPTAQQAYLKASNTDAGDDFGFAVDVSGDTVVVGALKEGSNASGVNGDQSDNSLRFAGAAYVFVRNGQTWTQEAYLKPSNPDDEDRFGFSVAVSGDTIVVGAIFEESDSNGVNGSQNNNGFFNGAAYVFVRSGTTWSQEAYLKASNTETAPRTGDSFGFSVAISGDTIVVGAPAEDSAATGVNGSQSSNGAPSSGAAYVFVRDGTTWSQEAYLKASNTESFDDFGTSVAVSGDTVVVGAHREDSAATGVNGSQGNMAEDSGAAYVFVRNGTSWSQEAYLKASNTNEEDRFGFAVAVSGDTVVVGADEEDSNSTFVNVGENDGSATDAGAAYVFVREGTSWSQEAYLKASNTDPRDHFGYSVAVAGETIVVGAFAEDSGATGVNGDQTDNSAPSSGAAYLFKRSGTIWSQQAYLKPSTSDAFDFFGIPVAVSGDTVAIGAYGEDSSATGVGGDQADNSADSSGAAHLFRIEPAECFLVLGNSPAAGSFTGATHNFNTQLSGVAAFHAVLLDDLPAFRLPIDPQRNKTRKVPVRVADVYAQILMWNPSVFPANPEQWSKGLHLSLWSDGTVSADRYGSKNGLDIAMEVFAINGQPFLRFPFSIEGYP